MDDLGELSRADGTVVSAAVRALQRRAAQELLAEARPHRIFHVLRTCPGLGTIRTSQRLPIVVTPYRFASKRGFWAYAAMAIVMRSPRLG